VTDRRQLAAASATCDSMGSAKAIVVDVGLRNVLQVGDEGGAFLDVEPPDGSASGDASTS
jgi:hypothetical protein